MLNNFQKKNKKKNEFFSSKLDLSKVVPSELCRRSWPPHLLFQSLLGSLSRAPFWCLCSLEGSRRNCISPSLTWLELLNRQTRKLHKSSYLSLWPIIYCKPEPFFHSHPTTTASEPFTCTLFGITTEQVSPFFWLIGLMSPVCAHLIEKTPISTHTHTHTVDKDVWTAWQGKSQSSPRPGRVFTACVCCVCVCVPAYMQRAWWCVYFYLSKVWPSCRPEEVHHGTVTEVEVVRPTPSNRRPLKIVQPDAVGYFNFLLFRLSVN